MAWWRCWNESKTHSISDACAGCFGRPVVNIRHISIEYAHDTTCDTHHFILFTISKSYIEICLLSMSEESSEKRRRQRPIEKLYATANWRSTTQHMCEYMYVLGPDESMRWKNEILTRLDWRESMSQHVHCPRQLARCICVCLCSCCQNDFHSAVFQCARDVWALVHYNMNRWFLLLFGLVCLVRQMWLSFSQSFYQWLWR